MCNISLNFNRPQWYAMKMIVTRVRTDGEKYFFTQCAIKLLNPLPQDVLWATRVKNFSKRIRHNCGGSVDQQKPKGPFLLKGNITLSTRCLVKQEGQGICLPVLCHKLPGGIWPATSRNRTLTLDLTHQGLLLSNRNREWWLWAHCSYDAAEIPTVNVALFVSCSGSPWLGEHNELQLHWTPICGRAAITFLVFSRLFLFLWYHRWRTRILCTAWRWVITDQTLGEPYWVLVWTFLSSRAHLHCKLLQLLDQLVMVCPEESR